MIIAPFYKKIKKSGSKHVNQRINVVNWIQILKMMKESFYKFNPKEYEFIVQTDSVTELLDLDCYRSPIDDDGLMASIVKSNTNFVKNHHGKMILVGADHLFVNRVDNFFEKDFDLAFFIGVKRKAVNNSVVLVNKNNSNSLLIDEFFQDRENIFFDELQPKVQEWGGDQSSISHLLEKEKIISQYIEHKKTFFNYNGLKIKLFDYGSNYVYAANRNGSVDNLKGDAIILDFKSVERKSIITDAYMNINKMHIRNIMNVLNRK